MKQDANFNVTALLNNSGAVVERYVYDPFGTATVLNAAWSVIGSSAYAWQHLHQGGKLDAFSGLVHFRNRDYSTSLGRWVSLDPIRFQAGDVNLYRYVGNNAVNALDPLGLIVYVWVSRNNYHQMTMANQPKDGYVLWFEHNDFYWLPHNERKLGGKIYSPKTIWGKPIVNEERNPPGGGNWAQPRPVESYPPSETPIPLLPPKLLPPIGLPSKPENNMRESPSSLPVPLNPGRPWPSTPPYTGGFPVDPIIDMLLPRRPPIMVIDIPPGIPKRIIPILPINPVMPTPFHEFDNVFRNGPRILFPGYSPHLDEKPLPDLEWRPSDGTDPRLRTPVPRK